MSLELLQEKLKKNNLDALYIPKNNMFLGQDILEEENNIFKLTGFSGSAAELIVTYDKAYLFTDGRYELQASMEVDQKKVEVFIKAGEIFSFLRNYKKDEEKSLKIGYNPWTISIEKLGFFKNINTFSRNEYPIEFIPFEIIPALENIKKPNIFELDIKYVGMNREKKLREVSEHIKASELDAWFFTAADSVSWLLNMRSDYLPNSPVLRAFALVDKEMNLTIFSDDFEQFENLKVLPLSKIDNEMQKYQGQKLNFDRKSPDMLRVMAEKHQIEIQNYVDICQRNKAIKNETEITCIKNAHIKDGVAVTKLLYWIDNNWNGKNELDIVEKLYDMRKQQDLFFSNSFDTIAGYGENGAIIHYRPSEKTNKNINGGSLLLLDSGGQYFDGTTDVTRTLPIGKTSEEMQQNYTLVLKAHIALADAFFPEKTSGTALDALARKVLWKEGKDYNHGTGHGVGFFSNVHEGPQNISPKEGHYFLLENMIVSIEPGFYKENHYGIRIENLYLIKNNGQNDMLCFEALTMIPIDTRLVNSEILTTEELNWLQNYNKTVYSALCSFLNNEEKIWLKKICNIKSE